MIVSYRRVSTQEQEVGLDAQQTSIDLYLAQKGWVLDFDFHEKLSGKTMLRPQLQKAIEAVEATGGTLIVSKLDRLSRSVADFANLTERATRAGWTIVVVDIGIDMTTVTGRLVANVMASVAQWERDTIALRIREALAEKAKQGIRPGRPVEDSTVHLVHQLRNKGMSYREIGKQLALRGVNPPGGGVWQASTIQGVLKR